MFKKQPAQIMVIVLLLLSILSIIALTATMTTVRDTQEQVQNKKYQQYYSLGEKMIFEYQRALGTEVLPNPATLVSITGEITSKTACSSIPGGIACTISGIESTEATTDSKETYDVYTEVVDTDYIKGYKLDKDQDLMLDILDDNANTTYLLWNETDTKKPSWNISYDYLDTNSNDYITKKAFFGPLFNITTPNSDGCLTVAPVPDQLPTLMTQIEAATGTYTKALKIELTTGGTCNNNITALDFRIKGLLASTNDTQIDIALVKADNTSMLQRTITTVTTTSTEGEANQNPENPATVLSSNYLLTTTPLSLFDYVLRTEQGITK